MAGTIVLREMDNALAHDLDLFEAVITFDVGHQFFHRAVGTFVTPTASILQTAEHAVVADARANVLWELVEDVVIDVV